MCIQMFENNQHIILTVKLLSKFLRHPFIENDEDVQPIFQNNLLVNLFCENFKIYNKIANELSKKSTDLENISYDGFSHIQHIKTRLGYAVVLAHLNLFEAANLDIIDFLYNILIENAVSEVDRNEFYKWLNNLLEKNEISNVEDKIFKVFQTKICQDKRSCQNLSFLAFETFLTVFYNINSKENHLNYFQSAASVIIHLKL